MYCETPKKQRPQTNQLKQIAMVLALSRGVLNNAKKDALSSCLLLTSTTIFCVEDAIPSVGRPFLKINGNHEVDVNEFAVIFLRVIVTVIFHNMESTGSLEIFLFYTF